ncbi:hypothetical protein [Endozoicomonas sp. YOMI1]|uniref:hypothetical protein n=1 Tax=Endozoicomonas sp. YOMI1 TaxID=2828739 RepID=UPI0021481E60|nr:hypothetical protein [Endozoicomonas sp. YOMI1]
MEVDSTAGIRSSALPGISESGEPDDGLQKKHCYGRFALKNVGVDEQNFIKRSFRQEESSCFYGSLPNPKKRDIKPVVMDAVQSRINETKSVVSEAGRKISQLCLEVREKYHRKVDSAGFQYCWKKLETVARSGRNIKFIRCRADEKTAFLGRKHFPGYLVYSTSNDCENANHKIIINGKKLKCGMLSKLYAEGYIERGKKGYADCGSTAQLEKRLQELALSDPALKFDCTSKLRGKCTETHCFQVDDFSLVLNKLVQKYWDMPCGDSKVFILNGGPLSYRKEPEHAGHTMVLCLEKKPPGILVIRHWDPNWTFLDQKVILGHPDCTPFLKLSDLYTSNQVDWFFSNGVGSLTLFEGESEELNENLYWHARQGPRGHCVFEFKNGIWIRRQEENTSMAEGVECVDNDTMKTLENCIWAIFADKTKSEEQKYELLTHFIDYTQESGLIKKLPYSYWKALGVSWIYLKSIMQDQDFDGQRWEKEYYSFYDYLLKVSNESESEYLASSLQVAVSNNDWTICEDIIRSVLMDPIKSVEEKKLILQAGRSTNCWFFEAVMNGKNHTTVLAYVYEVLQSDLPESMKVDLLEAKSKLGKPVLAEMLKYFNFVHLAHDYAAMIVNSNMDIQSKRKILSVDQSLQMIELLEESVSCGEVNQFNPDELQKIKESLNELKNEPNGF